MQSVWDVFRFHYLANPSKLPEQYFRNNWNNSTDANETYRMSNCSVEMVLTSTTGGTFSLILRMVKLMPNPVLLIRSMAHRHTRFLSFQKNQLVISRELLKCFVRHLPEPLGWLGSGSDMLCGDKVSNYGHNQLVGVISWLYTLKYLLEDF
jgi:hypothetical protein